MNEKNINQRIDVDKYLSIKRIVFMSLAITIGYYSLYLLSHHFARPSLASVTDEEMLDAKKEHAAIPVFKKFQQKWPQLFEDDRFQPGYKSKKPKIEYVMLYNVPFTFLMIFCVFLYNKWIMGKSFKRRSDELVANIVGTLLVSAVLSSICTILQLYIWPHGHGPERTLFGYISRGMLGDFTLVTIAFMFSYLQRSLYQEKKIAVENETLRAENLNSRYETLKNQMDPHFLFNSLNTLKSLIDVDAEKAEEFVQQLSSVLRYTLQNKELVTLAEEIDCVRAYCKMMKMRYGDNLLFDHYIDHETYDHYLVLPLSVQGLIENAIKHNVISSKQHLTVQIGTDSSNHLIISNKIQPKIKKEEGSGIGLANLLERYRIKWNENVEIFDDGTIFRVTLPLKENEKNYESTNH